MIYDRWTPYPRREELQAMSGPERLRVFSQADIGAIKTIRHRWDLSLREAKEIVDQIGRGDRE